MNRKRILQILLLSVILLSILVNIVRWVLDYYTPSFVLRLIDEAKADQVLMQRIGGYEEYSFSYTSPDLSKLHFEVSIHGGDSTITYEGQAAKVSERQWKVEQIKSTVCAR